MSSRYGGQGRKNVHAYRKGSFKAGVYGYALDAVVYQDANGKWRYAHNDKLAPTDLVTRIHRYENKHENKPPVGGIFDSTAPHAGSYTDQVVEKTKIQQKLNQQKIERQNAIIEERRAKLPKSFADQQDIKPAGNATSDASPGTMPKHERAKTKLTVTPDGKMSVTLTPESPSVRHHVHESEFDRGRSSQREDNKAFKQELKDTQQQVNKSRAHVSNERAKAIREEFLLNKQKGNVPKGLTLQEYQAIHYGSPLPKNYTVSDAYIKETTRTTRLEIIKTAHQRHEATRLKDESLYRDQVFKNAGVKKRHQPKLGETLGDERSKARRDLAGEVLRQDTYTRHATWDSEHQPNPREYKKIVVTRDNTTGHTHTSSHKESDQYRFGHATHNRAINSIKARIDKIEDPATRAVLLGKLNLFEHQSPFKSTYHELLTDIKRIRAYEKRSKKKK